MTTNSKTGTVYRAKTYNSTTVVVALSFADAEAKVKRVLRKDHGRPNAAIESIERVGDIEEA